MTDGVYGDVVECVPVDDVRMQVSRDRVVVKVDAPALDVYGTYDLRTDFETERRMVDGEVSWLLVVSDGGDG